MPNINVKWLSVIVLSVALSTAAYAAGRGGGGHGGGGHGGGGHGGGGHGGGGHGGGAHFSGGHGGGGHGGGARFAGGGRHFSGRAAVSRSAGSGVRGNNAATDRAATDHTATEHNATGNLSRANAGVHANAIHHALAGAAIAGALHNHNALNNPAARAHISAAAATAGWRGHGRHGGWWRHANGGYGWVGPLFWPFAYYDLSGYAMWGYDPSLWDYGYGDIYTGIFAPYGYDDLTGYLPSGSAPPSSGGATPPNQPNALAQMCGEDSQEIAGLPVDRIQQALNPNDEQRKALDDFANASVQAAQTIKAACPAQVVSTAPARLAAMQTRLEAMISAVNTVQPPLDHFYGLLNDEQKARLTALGEDQRRGRQADMLAQGCGQGQGQASTADWPAAEIDQRVHPTDTQRASLDNLKDASAKAADMLKGTCEPNEALTPPARLSAAGKRLDAMLQAVETVKSALDDVYAELNDEQKAQFESIGPARDVAQTAASDDIAPASRHYHHHHASVVGLVRRLIGF
jgi:hypothetical protein